MSNGVMATKDPASRRLWLGVDLGGTTAKLGLFQSEAKAGPGAGSGAEMDSGAEMGSGADCAPSVISRPALLVRTAIPTRLEDEGENILPDIADAAKELVEELSLTLSDIDGAGVGVPGPVLPVTDRGYPVDGCVNLNWEGIRYVDETLRQLTGIQRFYVCNDANAAALGELYFGTVTDGDDASATGEDPGTAAGPVSSAVMITIGTGIGGGIIQDGQIISGAFGAAGEVGHMPISPADPFFLKLREAIPELLPCSDLEYYASATGIVRMAKAALAAEKKSREIPDSPATASDSPATPEGSGRSVLHEIADRGSLEARHVIDAAKAGDPIGVAVTEFFFHTLGQGLASIASVVDPDLFIIGGGVSAAGQFLLDGLQKAYQAQVFHASRRTAFRLASMGNDAGLMGPLVPLMRE